MFRTKLILAATPVLGAGCIPSERASFDSPSPNRRLDAIVRAAEGSDVESLEGLVSQLDSSDPAARLLAIRALERRTGQTLGYDHAAPEWMRQPAVDRWKKHVAEQAQIERGGSGG